MMVKRKVILLLILISCVLVTNSFAGKFKKYPFKSGKIVYEYQGSTKGERIMYWDDYGFKEVTIEKYTIKGFLGMTTKTNSTTLYSGKYMYSWENDDDKIFKEENPLAYSIENGNFDENDYDAYGKAVMDSMGFKKVDDEKILGKKCEVYKGIGKIWIWKGITLKMKTEMLGVNITFAATEIKTKVRVPKSVFELPKDKKVVTSEEYISSQSESDEDDEVSKEDMENAKKMLKSLFGGSDD